MKTNIKNSHPGKENQRKQNRKNFLIWVWLAAVLAITTALWTPARSQEQEVEVLKGIIVCLPSGAQIKVDWVMPPVEPSTLEKYGGRVKFSIDQDGLPVIGLGNRLILNPVKGYRGLLSEPFQNFFHVGNNLLLFSTGEDFGFIPPVSRLARDLETGFPIFPYQPIALIPESNPADDYLVTERSLFRGENCLYFKISRLYQNSNPEYAQEVIYCLKGEPLTDAEVSSANEPEPDTKEVKSSSFSQTTVVVNGQVVYSSSSTDYGESGPEPGMEEGQTEESLTEKFVKTLAFKPVLITEPVSVEEVGQNRIQAVTGDGERTFYAAGDSIYELEPGATEPVLLYSHPEGQEIRALEFSQESGLVYSTFDSVGVAAKNAGLEFLKSAWPPEIFLTQGNLYVMFTGNAGIIRFENIGVLKKYNSPEREILKVDGRKLGGVNRIMIWPLVFLLLFGLWLVALVKLLKSDSQGGGKVFYLLWLLLGSFALTLALLSRLFLGYLLLGDIFLLFSGAIILSYFIFSRPKKESRKQKN
ncbi:MAG: hypothetical protein H5U05_09025 [Candidatus Aminicenantes bacterium]|nr:hypothetical protein [Candidatus Aminicenantes bacterium]